MLYFLNQDNFLFALCDTVIKFVSSVTDETSVWKSTKVYLGRGA